MKVTWAKYRAIIEKDGKWYRSGLFLCADKPIMLGFIRPISKDLVEGYLNQFEGEIRPESKLQGEAFFKRREEWLLRFFNENYILQNRGAQVECILDGDKYPVLPKYENSQLGRNPRNLEEHLLFA